MRFVIILSLVLVACSPSLVMRTDDTGRSSLTEQSRVWIFSTESASFLEHESLLQCKKIQAGDTGALKEDLLFCYGPLRVHASFWDMWIAPVINVVGGVGKLFV